MKLKSIVERIPINRVPRPSDLEILNQVAKGNKNIPAIRVGLEGEGKRTNRNTLDAQVGRLLSSGWLTKDQLCYQLMAPIELSSGIDLAKVAKAASLNKFLLESGLTIKQALQILNQLK